MKDGPGPAAHSWHLVEVGLESTGIEECSRCKVQSVPLAPGKRYLVLPKDLFWSAIEKRIPCPETCEEALATSCAAEVQEE